MKMRVHEEDGVAMITAIMVSAIVLMMSVTAVSMSIHNTDASGYDKRRLMAIDAAEAGIDQYYALLGATSFNALPGATGSSACILTQTLGASPAAGFQVTPQFYRPDGTPNTCAQIAAYAQGVTSLKDVYVELTSVGNVAGQSAPVRTMASRARLSTSGSGLVFPAAAMYGSTSVALSANVQVFGNGASNADLYSDGPLSVSTQSNIKGNMYVQGTATIANGNFQLTGDLWAKSWVKVSGGSIGGALISSGSTTTTCASGASPASAAICVSGNTSVGGGAKTGGTISIKSPANVQAPLSPNTPGIADPPKVTYPAYTFTAGDWPGYVTRTSCAAATTEIANWTSGNLYIRLTGCPTFNPSTKAMPGHLAILTDGAVTMTTGVKLTNSTSTPHTVYFFTGMPGGTIETSVNCSSGGNFTAEANTGIGSNLKTIIFTPKSCTTTLKSNSLNAVGQVFSGTIAFQSNSAFTYSPISLPQETADNAPGYLVDPVYRREMPS